MKFVLRNLIPEWIIAGVLFNAKDFLHTKPVALTHRKVCAANLHPIAFQAFNLMDGDYIGFVNSHEMR